MGPTISRIESVEFTYELTDVGYAPNGFSVVYQPGETSERSLFALRVETDDGVTGEYVGGNSPGAAELNMVAAYLVGKNALAREEHWNVLKRALRKYDWMGLGPIDIALWDLAGKHYDAPIHELLGTYREEFPAYASTFQGDRNGGLDTPGDFANFAEQCLDLGYEGFKIHDWGR
jgi:L-alanine-DL-glutamate epimerase-like enolase superfamily enzyme